MVILKPMVLYVAAAVAEIAGCFAFWAWARLSGTTARRSPPRMTAGSSALAAVHAVVRAVNVAAAWALGCRRTR